MGQIITHLLAVNVIRDLAVRMVVINPMVLNAQAIPTITIVAEII